MNQVIAAIARKQLGLVTLGQLTDGGLTGRQIQHRLQAALFERVHEGVYRVAGAPRSWEQDVLAAWLAAGPEACASHRTAAALWELGVGEDIVEITVSLPRFNRLDGVVVHRSTDLTPEATTRRRGVVVTTPARTLVDLGAVHRPRAVEQALERALSRRLVTLAGLRTTLQAVARRGRRGAGVLRALLDERSDAAELAESVLEARFLRLCREHGLPEPTCQYRVQAGQRLVGRVDFAFPANKLAIEVDGYEAHSSLAAFQHDRVRQNDLVTMGWTVLRFTWDDVACRPELVATATARILRAQINAAG